MKVLSYFLKFFNSAVVINHPYPSASSGLEVPIFINNREKISKVKQIVLFYDKK